MEGCAAPQRNANHTMTDPPPNRSCWRMLQAAERSPWRLQTLSGLSRAQGEPAIIWEEHRVPVANLPILVFSGKCQTFCTCWAVSTTPTCGHRALIPPSWSLSDRLSRHMHMVWQCSSCSSLHKAGGSGPAAGLLRSYSLLHVS